MKKDNQAISSHHKDHKVLGCINCCMLDAECQGQVTQGLHVLLSSEGASFIELTHLIFSNQFMIFKALHINFTAKDCVSCYYF